MNKNTLISIAMTCYNQGHFIKEAIKSVLIQTYINWELVIVDDCSTDGSFARINDLIKKFNIENKTKVIRHEINKGYGSSLDRAIRESSGELIAVVDSDDALADKDALKIERDVHIKHPEAALVYSNYILCNKLLKRKGVYKTRALKKGEKYLGTKIRISHFKMLKKKYYEMTEGINPKLRQCVDKDLNLKLEEVGKLVYVDADLLYYRQHPDNLSRSVSRKKSEYQDFVIKMRKQIYKDARKRREIKKIKNIKIEKTEPAQKGNNIHSRDYNSYEEYIKHQKKKTMNKERKRRAKLVWDKTKIVFIDRFKCLDDYIVSGKALCLGSRFGVEVEVLQDKGFDAIGIDLVPFPPYTIEGDFHNMPFDDNVFDLIFSNAVDHVFNLEKFSKEIERVLKPGGYILFNVFIGAYGKYESLRIDRIDDLILIFNNFSIISNTTIGTKKIMCELILKLNKGK